MPPLSTLHHTYPPEHNPLLSLNPYRYLDAKAKQGELVVTSPYKDFYGAGWMVTFATSIHNPETGAFLGVVRLARA